MNNLTNLQLLFFIFVSIISGLSFRFSLAYAKQLWAQTFHYSITFSLLPPITMVITKLISGNIALSLGMIGALSIVRFRNPVKNPFELVLYFGLITIGIAFAIDYKFGLGLTIILNFVILLFAFVEKIYEKKGKKIFSFSFDEANKKNFLLIKSTKPIKDIESNINLINYDFNKTENIFAYELIFENRSELTLIKKKLETNEEIINIQARFID